MRHRHRAIAALMALLCVSIFLWGVDNLSRNPIRPHYNKDIIRIEHLCPEEYKHSICYLVIETSYNEKLSR